MSVVGRRHIQWSSEETVTGSVMIGKRITVFLIVMPQKYRRTLTPVPDVEAISASC